MIYFDPAFIKTGYPGYLWNVVEKKLYTLKVNGVLRPMTFHKGGFPYGNGKLTIPGYQISDKGVRKTLTLNYLLSLKQISCEKYQ